MITTNDVVLADENLEFSDIQPAGEILKNRGYGAGAWWWPKSCETYNREIGYRRLLKPGEREVFDTLNFLVWANKSWMIRAAATFVSEACGGRPAHRTIEDYFAKFRKLGLIALQHLDKDNGNVYLVNPIAMAEEPAAGLAHYKVVAPMVARIRALQAPKRKPQKRTQGKFKRKALSREEQLEVVRQQRQKIAEAQLEGDTPN